MPTEKHPSEKHPNEKREKDSLAFAFTGEV
jgi:hypothetical protein